MIWKSFENIVEEGSYEFELLSKIDPENLPVHIAVIMDGNGRWAKARGLPRIEGHKAGTDSVRETVETSARLGIKHLTLYAFSVENWKRPKSEVNELMRLLRKYLRTELPTLQKHNIRLKTLGRIEELDQRTKKRILISEEKTLNNDGLQLNIALNYGGRTEIVDTIKKICSHLSKGKIKLSQIDANTFEKFLYTKDIPDPDLLIRTSGEYRISNFLLWQMAYTEFYFTPVLWPDFRKKDLFEAIIDFQKRERRFGGI